MQHLAMTQVHHVILRTLRLKRITTQKLNSAAESRCSYALQRAEDKRQKTRNYIGVQGMQSFKEVSIEKDTFVSLNSYYPTPDLPVALAM